MSMSDEVNVIIDAEEAIPAVVDAPIEEAVDMAGAEAPMAEVPAAIEEMGEAIVPEGAPEAALVEPEVAA